LSTPDAFAALLVAAFQAAIPSALSVSRTGLDEVKVVAVEQEVPRVPRVDGPPGEDLVPPPQPAPASERAAPEGAEPQTRGGSYRQGGDGSGVKWRNVVGETLFFTFLQHSARTAIVEGPWLRDWFDAASSPFRDPTWSDKGKFFTNYIAHPMQGSVYGYIYARNAPSAATLAPGFSRKYFAHLSKASAWSAIASLQFEIGPFSEASMGNVGMAPDRVKMAWVDIVVTPILGTAWMAGEDALDYHLIRRLDRKIGNSVLRHTVRILLNPTRSFSNLVGFERPWKRYRDF
jgi:hypothetical protein